MTATTDAIVKAIVTAKEVTNAIAAIAAVTKGEALPEKRVSEVERKLTERYVDSVPSAEDNKRKARQRWVADLVNTLKAAPALPVILAKAEELFPANAKDLPARDGGKGKAIRAGIDAYVEKPERNDVVVQMEAAVPLLNDTDARAKEAKAIRKAIADLGKRMTALGIHADAVTQLTNVAPLVK